MARVTSYARGFTLVELTFVLGLITVVMGLVVARFDWGGPRQQAIAQARTLGNTIRAYREHAIAHRKVYGLKLDVEANAWSIFEPLPSAPEPRILETHQIKAPLALADIKADRQRLKSPVIVYFTPKGIMPELSVQILTSKEASIFLSVDPVLNEVKYDER